MIQQKSTILNIFLAFLLIIIFPALAAAAGNIYHVTPSGAGSRNGSDWNNAYSRTDFQSLSTSTDFGGDIFYFRGTFGTKLEVKIKGSSGNGHVILDGWKDGQCNPTATLTKCHTTAGGDSYAAMIDTNSFYDGSDGNGSSMHGITMYGNGSSQHPQWIILQDFTVQNNGGDGLHVYNGVANASLTRPHHIVIRRNYFFHNGYDNADHIRVDNITFGGAAGDGNVAYNANYFSDHRNVGFGTWTNIHVSHNRIWHDEYSIAPESGNCLGINNGQNAIVEYNENSYSPDETGVSIKESGVNNYIVRYNYFHHNAANPDQYPYNSGEGYGIGIGYYSNFGAAYGNMLSDNFGGFAIKRYARNAYIFSNVVVNNKFRGIDISRLLDPSPENIRIFNNTISGNVHADRQYGGACPDQGTCGDDCCEEDDNGLNAQNLAGDSFIKNNIITYNRDNRSYNTKIQIRFFDGGTSAGLEHNSYWRTGGSAGMDIVKWNNFVDYNLSELQGSSFDREDNSPPGQVVEPKFATIGNNAYALASDSPNIGQGININLGTIGSVSVEDGYGTTRTVNLTEEVKKGIDPNNTNFEAWPIEVTMVDRNDYQWDRGAYVHISGSGDPNHHTVCNTGGCDYTQNGFEGLTGNWAGHTFFFSGEFDQQLDVDNIYGSSSEPLVLDGYGSPSQDYDCSPIVTDCVNSAYINRGFASGSGIRIYDADYITIQDFRIGNIQSNGISADASTGGSNNLIFKRNEIFNIYDPNSESGGVGINLTGGEDYITVGGSAGNGNDIHHIGNDSSSSDVQSAGSNHVIVSYNRLWSDGTTAGIDGINCTSDCDYWLVEYNTIFGHLESGGGEESEDGIDIKGKSSESKSSDYWVVRYNHIYNNGQSGINTQDGSSYLFIYGNNVHDNGLRTNSGSRNGISVYQFSDSTMDIHHLYMWSNILYRNPFSGIGLTSGGGNIDNVYMYNNTLGQNGWGAGSSDQWYNWRFYKGSNHEFKNNIIYKPRPQEGDGRQGKENSGVGVTYGYNLYYNDGSSQSVDYGSGFSTLTLSSEPNISLSNPGLVSLSTHDYRIASQSSVAYSSGQNLNQCFGPYTINGRSVEPCLNEALGSNTDWSTTLPTVEVISRSSTASNWDRGAYAYSQPSGISMVFHTGWEPPIDIERTSADGAPAIYHFDNVSPVDQSVSCNYRTQYCNHGLIDGTTGYNVPAEIPGRYAGETGLISNIPQITSAGNGDQTDCEVDIINSSECFDGSCLRVRSPAGADPGDGRCQLTISSTSSGLPYDNFNETLVVFWVKWKAATVQMPDGWFMIHEWRSDPSPGHIQLYVKPRNGTPRFVLEQTTTSNVNDNLQYWSETVDIPVDEWIQMMVYKSYGSNGRLIWKYKRIGQAETLILDQTWDNDNWGPINNYMPIKHYGSDYIPISHDNTAYYDDFKFYSPDGPDNLPPWMDETQSTQTIFYVCGNATSCNAGNGSGWTTGNDSTGDGSWATPWATIEHATENIEAGDTIIVGDGTYNQHDQDGGDIEAVVEVGTSGTSDKWITIKAENKYGVRIAAEEGTYGSDAEYGFWVNQGINYIIIDGFDIDGGANGVFLGKINATIDTHDIILRNCKIRDTKDESDANADDNSCIKTQKWTWNVLIEKNEFSGCGTGPLGFTAGGGQSIGYAIYLTGTEIVIENNIFHSPALYAGPFIKLSGYEDEYFGGGSFNPTKSGWDIEILNNTFDGHNTFGQEKRRHQMWLVGDEANGGFNDDVLISGNAFYNPTNNDQGSWECTNIAICINNNGDYGSGDIHIYNNRSDDELYGVESADPAYSPTTSSNLDESDGFTQADFAFTNTTGNDYSLTGDSLLINAITTYASYVPSDDFIGIARPYPPYDDIGAYEYSGAVDVETPAQLRLVMPDSTNIGNMFHSTNGFNIKP